MGVPTAMRLAAATFVAGGLIGAARGDSHSFGDGASGGGRASG